MDAIKITLKYGCSHIYTCNMNILRYEYFTASITRYHIVPCLYVKIDVFSVIANVSFCPQSIAFGRRSLIAIIALLSIIILGFRQPNTIAIYFQIAHLHTTLLFIIYSYMRISHINRLSSKVDILQHMLFLWHGSCGLVDFYEWYIMYYVLSNMILCY